MTQMQTAAMVQINAQTITQIKKICDQIADVDRKILACMDVRRANNFVMGTIDVLSTSGSDKIMLLPKHCPALLDMIEIMHRKERAQHLERLDTMGIVLTEQADIGPAPEWPAEPSWAHTQI